MENATVSASYIASVEQRLSALTAERDSLREEALGLSQELQRLQALSERLSSERDNLQDAVQKMQDELRQLRRMLFGRKSERFIPSDPSQIKLDFEGVAELKEERNYPLHYIFWYKKLRWMKNNCPDILRCSKKCLNLV